jgi:anti-anti-sigma regulatory factor/DNA-directed RNA polymerase subunit RPC12/RpoP
LVQVDREGIIKMEVQKSLVGTVLLARVSGVVDENTNFNDQIGSGFTEAVLDCKKITRMNSMGVKFWINYFSALTSNGVKVTLSNCAPPVVDQMSLVDTFHSNCHIESVMVPYECVSCKSEFLTTMTTTELKEKLDIPEEKCVKCSQKAVFSDIEEEYFAFLEYTK